MKETRIFVDSSDCKPRKIELTILKLGNKPNSKITFNWKLYDLNSGEQWMTMIILFHPLKQ